LVRKMRSRARLAELGKGHGARAGATRHVRLRFADRCPRVVGPSQIVGEALG